MAVTSSPGYVGNLSSDQEAKLRQIWSIILTLNDIPQPEFQDVTLENQEKRPRSVHRRSSSLSKTVSNTSNSNLPSDLDQILLGLGINSTELKTIRDCLNRASIDEIRRSLLSTAKQDHPDSLLLRFIRARKWDVSKAFAMMLEALVWRVKEQHVDEMIVSNSELRALKESENKSNPEKAKAGSTFLAQMRMGKCYVHGTDRAGRPIGIVKARLHNPKAQSEDVIKRYILHVIESARLVLVPPVESVEYAPVKFLIDCFQANYPESLGVMLIHNAPWIFSGIWKIIKGWMDPVIVSKVDFTYTAADLEKHISPEQLVKELGGKDQYEYKFIEPVEGENERMEDTVARDALLSEREKIGEDLLKATAEWIEVAKEDDSVKITAVKERRNDIIEQMRLNYWKLDPYVRGRGHLDREGVIGVDGKVSFYPKTESEVQTTETKAVAVKYIASTQAKVVNAQV
ncbi:CRAL-TRIO domain-containing protein [Aspergillus caelatus]|uniref:CRAL-TRIO domain-containing protein n=1 Tax=Aspergillus caelatus TaxID=61420 RepID=A0A5N7A0L6_9EURO|nr:CRAL-TRIO domain-containing protein [Aspergillus caelatus]KAE8363414.1 CRAL-TRIO domain-containing protein [Aspergillus caelatus]